MSVDDVRIAVVDAVSASRAHLDTGGIRQQHGVDLLVGVKTAAERRLMNVVE